MTVTTDAVIIGGGVMGTSILYNLATHGVRSPILLERDTLGSGSTGRSSGAVRMHYSTTVNAHLAWESLKIFRNWDDAVGGGDCGFVHTGYMVFVPEESHEGLKHNIALQQAVGIETEIISKEEAQELAPVFDYADGESYAWEPQSGHADPSGTAMAYAARLAGDGRRDYPRITRHQRGDRKRPGSGREYRNRAVRSADRRYCYRPLVGSLHGAAWLRSPPGGHTARGVPHSQAHGQAALPSRRRRHGKPDLLRPEGSDLTLVGNGNDEDIADPDDYSPSIHADHLEDVWLRLARRIPDIADGELFTGYAGLYTSTPDLHPIIDQVDDIEGLYLCTGFSGHGFKLAPAIGICMAQMILEGGSKLVDFTPLRMSRFAEGDLNTTTYKFK